MIYHRGFVLVRLKVCGIFWFVEVHFLSNSLLMLSEGRAYNRRFVRPSVHPSVRRNKCILMCLNILDTSMYFNGIYSVDTQVSLFVCLKYGRVCHFFLNFLENEAHKVLCRDEDTQVYIRKALSVRPSIHPSVTLLSEAYL